MNAHDHRDTRPPGLNWSRINQWVLWLGLAAAVAWLFFRHNAHIGQLLPFLILLACPLLHLFGHGGHGAGHGGHGGQSGQGGDGGPADRNASDATKQPPASGQVGHKH
ncbi:MAG: DUF2933 domain-containing protein [Rubrivivax sp.]|nr:DUF2933 domain-containing protein [Rubrivivax sp.]